MAISAVTTKQIRDLGREIVLRHPGEIHFGELVRQIRTTYPEAQGNTVATQVANYLVPAFPTEIAKPSRGLYKPLGDGNALGAGAGAIANWPATRGRRL